MSNDFFRDIRENISLNRACNVGIARRSSPVLGRLLTSPPSRFLLLRFFQSLKVPARGRFETRRQPPTRLNDSLFSRRFLCLRSFPSAKHSGPSDLPLSSHLVSLRAALRYFLLHASRRLFLTIWEKRGDPAPPLVAASDVQALTIPPHVFCLSTFFLFQALAVNMTVRCPNEVQLRPRCRGPGSH